MIVWRIERPEYADEALRGVGAGLYGGRWNHPGTPLVYLSTSLSLAAYERFVHGSRANRHQALVALGYRVDVEAAWDRPDILPSDWRAAAPSKATMDWGSGWANGDGPMLAGVPSVLLPLDMWQVTDGEYNVLYAPAKAAGTVLSEVARLPFAYDPRMWK